VVPTQFGIAFTAVHLNQAGALVLVYQDGSVLLSHGGTEMGQGLHTKMIQVSRSINTIKNQNQLHHNDCICQVAARALQIPESYIHISDTSTDKVPNTSPTAASASSDLNGMAVYVSLFSDPHKTFSKSNNSAIVSGIVIVSECVSGDKREIETL